MALIKIYFRMFQDLTVQLGPDPLAKMKLLCERAMAHINRGSHDIKRLWLVLQEKTKEYVPGKPDLFKLLYSKTLPLLKIKRQQLSRKLSQLYLQRAASSQSSGSGGAAGGGSGSSQQQEQPGEGGHPKTEFENEFGETVDNFVIVGDMSLADELNVLSWPSFPPVETTQGCANADQSGDAGTSSPATDDGATDGMYTLNEDGEYQLMIEQAKPSAHAATLQQTASKKARLPQWRMTVVPLGVRRFAACESSGGFEDSAFESERASAICSERSNTLSDTLEGQASSRTIGTRRGTRLGRLCDRQ